MKSIFKGKKKKIATLILHGRRGRKRGGQPIKVIRNRVYLKAAADDKPSIYLKYLGTFQNIPNIYLKYLESSEYN